MKIRIALAQINSTVGDLEGNAGKIIAAVAAARDAGADIVLTPELAVCGYPPEDLLFRRSFLERTRLALERVAEAARGVTALVGFAEAAEGRVFNSAALLDDGRRAATYRKMELPNYGVFDENRYFAPGAEPLAFEFGGGACGALCQVTICEDVWVEGGRAEASLLKVRPDVVLNLSASPFHAGKVSDRHGVLARVARLTGAHVCYCNLVGGQDELVFDGGGVVVGTGGELVAASRRFEENMLIVDIEAGGESKERDKNLKPIKVVPKDKPASAAPVFGIAPEAGRVEEIYEALVLGTRDYVRKNGFSKVTLGLSGGIDSALTCAVAVAALGKENVVAVTMPSRFSSEETRSDAALLAANLGVKLFETPVSGPLEAYLEALKAPFGDGPLGLEFENLQARIRGNYLMALSNRFGWLVLTTGNKSESAVGYCTLYGDMAGGFAVIKDLLKGAVYEVSEYVNENAGREIIPRTTIERAPTAELRPNQKDEDSLPPYPLLDRILHLYVERDMGFEEIVEAGFDAGTVAEVIRMVDRAEYKRRQAPPGVKITPKAFGRDRRLPITNRFRQGPKI